MLIMKNLSILTALAVMTLMTSQAHAVLLGYTGFEEATPGTTTGFTRGAGDTELEWSVGAGSVNDPFDLIVHAASTDDGNNLLQVRQTTPTITLKFEDIDIQGSNKV